MDVKARAKFIRMSPRKVRLVVDLVRGLPVLEAKHQLQFLNKAASVPVLKLINSAAANAEHNFNLKVEDLVVKSITADGGPTIHRWKPRARGRASAIRKRTTHIAVVLSDGKDEPVEKAKKVEKVSKEAKTTKPKTKKPAAKKAPAKKTTAKKTATKKTTKKTTK